MNTVKHWWQAMGFWRWLNLLPLVIVAYLAPQYEAMPSTWLYQGARSLDGVAIELYTHGKLRAGQTLPIRLELSQPIAFRVAIDTTQVQLATYQAVDGVREIELNMPVPETENAIAELQIVTTEGAARWRLGQLIL